MASPPPPVGPLICTVWALGVRVIKTAASFEPARKAKAPVEAAATLISAALDAG